MSQSDLLTSLPVNAPSPTAQPPSNSGLGELLAAYHGRSLRCAELTLLYLPLALLALGLSGWGIYLAVAVYAYHGPLLAISWSWPWLVAGSAVLIFGLLLGLFRLRTAGRRLVLHAQGVHHYGWLRPARILLWDELSGLASAAVEDRLKWRGVERTWRTQTRAVFYPLHGRPLRLDDTLADLPKLVIQAKAAFYPHLLPRLRADFRAGHPIVCGPLSVQHSALTVSGHSYPWVQVSRLSVANGQLMIQLIHGAPLHVPVAKIPNLEPLLQIIAEEVRV